MGNGARGRICTCTGDALDVVPLLVGLRERKEWSLLPVLPRREFFTKEICRLLQGGEDRSPGARAAAKYWSPHPESHRALSHTKGMHRSKCFGGAEKWWERRVLPSLPLACQTSALLVSYAPEIGIPSRILTGNLTLRSRPLCGLSYGDKESNSWPVSSTGSRPAIAGNIGPLDLLRVQEFEILEWYARPVTLRNPALI